VPSGENNLSSVLSNSFPSLLGIILEDLLIQRGVILTLQNGLFHLYILDKILNLNLKTKFPYKLFLDQSMRILKKEYA